MQLTYRVGQCSGGVLSYTRKKRSPCNESGIWKYSVGWVVVVMSWVDICFWPFPCQPHSAWATGSLAEWAVGLGRMMEYNSKSI